MERVEAFKSILESKRLHAFIRRPRGRDILAACGQLAARSASGEVPILEGYEPADRMTRSSEHV